MCCSFHAICWKRIKSNSGKQFKQFTQPFFFSIVSNMVSNCIMHTWSLAQVRHEMHGFAHPIIPHFSLAFKVFSFVLRTKLGLPHPLVFKVTHCICGQPLDPTRTHLLHYSHNGMDYIPRCCLACLHLHHKKRGVLCVAWTNPCTSTTFPLVFLPKS